MELRRKAGVGVWKDVRIEVSQRGAPLETIWYDNIFLFKLQVKMCDFSKRIFTESLPHEIMIKLEAAHLDVEDMLDMQAGYVCFLTFNPIRITGSDIHFYWKLFREISQLVRHPKMGTVVQVHTQLYGAFDDNFQFCFPLCLPSRFQNLARQFPWLNIDYVMQPITRQVRTYPY